MRKVQFTETVLRDANQSLMATRLPYKDYEGILTWTRRVTTQSNAGEELHLTHVSDTWEKIRGSV